LNPWEIASIICFSLSVMRKCLLSIVG
jgi:hypothetical protein